MSGSRGKGRRLLHSGGAIGSRPFRPCGGRAASRFAVAANLLEDLSIIRIVQGFSEDLPFQIPALKRVIHHARDAHVPVTLHGFLDPILRPEADQALRNIRETFQGHRNIERVSLRRSGGCK
jgi:hypothetical protein